MTTFIRQSLLLNDQLREGKLSLTGYGLYSMLRYRYGLGKVDIDIPALSSDLDLSEATIRKKLRELSSLGWIVTERKNSLYGRNQYWVCLDPFEKESSESGVVEYPDNDGVLHFVHVEEV